MPKEPGAPMEEVKVREKIGFSPEIWWTQIAKDIEKLEQQQEELSNIIKQRVAETGLAKITEEEAATLKNLQDEINKLGKLYEDAFTLIGSNTKGRQIQ